MSDDAQMETRPSAETRKRKSRRKDTTQYPVEFSEFAQTAKARKTLLAGFRASLNGEDHPRLMKDWQRKFEAYCRRPVT